MAVAGWRRAGEGAGPLRWLRACAEGAAPLRWLRAVAACAEGGKRNAVGAPKASRRGAVLAPR